MTTRGIFILENVRSRQREGDWVPLPSVFGRDSLQQIGYVVGGSDNSDNTVSYYQSISYSSDTRSNVANLPQARAGVYGLASPSNGYAVGGGAGTTGTPGTYYSSSNKLNFSTQTNSALPGVNMSESFGRGGSTGSTTAGYIGGGYSVPGEPNGWSRLEKLTYSTETMARIPGSNLPGRGYGGATGHSQSATANGDLFGIWIAGNNFPSPSSNLTGTQVMRFQFNTDQWDGTVPSWNLSGPGNRLQKAGMTASGTGAYIVGGSYPANTRVQKISFSDMTNSVVTNTAAPGRTDLTGTGNPSTGYYAGGATGNNANGTGGSASSIVEKMSYGSDTLSRVPSLDLANSLSKTGSMSAAGDNKTLLPITQTFTGKEASFNFGYSMTGRVHPSSNHSYMEVTYKVDYGTDTSAQVPSANVSYGMYEAFGSGNSLAAYKMGGKSNDVPADGSERSEKVVYATDTRAGTPNYGNRRYGSFSVTDGQNALYGIGGKGQSSNQVKTDTFRLYYSSETWSAIPGAGDDLETARRDGASMATSTHGYFAGGGNYPGSPSSPFTRSDVDKMTFSSTTTNRIPSANLPQSISKNKGWSNTTAGYSFGGVDTPGTYYSSINKLTFATDTTAAFPGSNLPSPMYDPQTMTSDTTGYNAGGNSTTGGHLSSVAKMSFATGTFSASGNLPTYQYSGVGASAGNDNLPFQVPPVTTPTSDTMSVPMNFGLRGSGGTKIDKLDFSTDTVSVGMEMPSDVPETGGHDGGAWYDQTGGRTIFGTGGASGPINQINVSSLTGSRIPSLSPAGSVPNIGPLGLYKSWTYSATEGWYQGGRSWSPSYPSHNTSASRMTFATDTLEDQSYGRLANGVERALGLSAPSHHYVTGGRTSNGSGDDRSYVQKASFASGEFSQIPSGNLDAKTSDHGGTGNTTEGYIAGRLSSPSNGSPSESRFQKLTYSNDTRQILPGSTLGISVPSSGQYLEGTGTQTTGYFGGGDYMGPLNGNNFPIRKLVYATGTPSAIPSWVTSDTIRNAFQQSAGEQTGNGTAPVPNNMK